MNMKYSWIGGLCLLSATLLAWISPPEGVAGLVRIAVREDRMESSRTKVRERDGEAKREAGSLAEEYLMKAKRGMTEDEVRWVVEDFMALGLDVEYPKDKTAEGYLALRKAREDWYLGALVSGLRLTKEQEMQARERMVFLREKRYAEFVEYLDGLKSFEHEGKEMKVFDGGKARELTDPVNWMNEEGYRPWELCVLSKDQLAVTNFRYEIRNEDEARKFRDWLLGSDEANEPAVETDFSEEFAIDIGDLYGLGILGFGYVDCFFPLGREQAKKLLGEPQSTFQDIAMVFQPEQLKVYLLFHPQVAEALTKEPEMKVE